MHTRARTHVGNRETRTEQEKRLQKLLRSCRAALDIIFRSVKECTAHALHALRPAPDLNSSMEEFVCPSTFSHHIASELACVVCMRTHTHTHTQMCPCKPRWAPLC